MGAAEAEMSSSSEKGMEWDWSEGQDGVESDVGGGDQAMMEKLDRILE